MKVFRLLQKHPPMYSSIFILLAFGDDVEIARRPTICCLALPSHCWHLTYNYIPLGDHLCPLLFLLIMICTWTAILRGNIVYIRSHEVTPCSSKIRAWPLHSSWNRFGSHLKTNVRVTIELKVPHVYTTHCHSPTVLILRSEIQTRFSCCKCHGSMIENYYYYYYCYFFTCLLFNF